MKSGLSKKTLIIYSISSLIYLTILTSIQYPLNTILKPIPIIYLMIAVLRHTNKNPPLLAALFFSLLGDIVLTLPYPSVLEWGIAFFLIAHCCYIVLFFKNIDFTRQKLLYFLPIFLFVGVVVIKFSSVLGTMQTPVICYLSVLTTMVFMSFQVRDNALIIALGGLLFLISDLTLALYQFVLMENYLRIVIMLTYYSAQVLLAAGILCWHKKNSINFRSPPYESSTN